MSLYRIVEVPDPTGQLADLLSELIDNSALVEVNPNIEAAFRFYSNNVEDMTLSTTRLIELTVAAALTPPGDTGACEWPGCVDPGTQLAHLTHRGMGGSKAANVLDNAALLCSRHHDCLDGRTGLGTLRWELNEMLRYVVTH